MEAISWLEVCPRPWSGSSTPSPGSTSPAGGASPSPPAGRPPPRNPATYTKTFDLIRALFAKTPDARMRGYKPGRFSFNLRGGRCEACEGDGIVRIEMHFLPDLYVPCEG